MCRKQTDQVSMYKPLGVLKRSMAARPTNGKTAARVTTTGALQNNASVPSSVASVTLVFRSPRRMKYKLAEFISLFMLF